MNDALADRRNRLRFELAYETFCTIPVQDDIAKPICGHVADLSQTGLRMRAPLRPGTGAKLSATLHCALSGITEPVRIEIVYVASSPSGQYEIGAKFLPALPIGVVDRFVSRPAD